jgi:hypothetical protein
MTKTTIVLIPGTWLTLAFYKPFPDAVSEAGHPSHPSHPGNLVAYIKPYPPPLEFTTPQPVPAWADEAYD